MNSKGYKKKAFLSECFESVAKLKGECGLQNLLLASLFFVHIYG